MAFADSIRTLRPTRENIATLIEQAGMGISNYCTSVSGATTITATCSSVTAYATGQHYWILPAGNNTTGGTTLNINSLGAKTCVTQNGRPLVLNMLIANIWAHFVYNGTNMVLLNVQTEWADYTPTFAAASGSWSPGINMARYRIDDNYTCHVNMNLSDGSISATPAYISFTLPLVAKNLQTQYAPCTVQSASGNETGVIYIAANTSIALIYRPGLATFGSGNARAWANFNYMGGP